ncbi:phage protein NinX family protein [uncultured Amphritea sp.]|uniref:phage protein NinX family protein n=1 Tax=uncultured Amphritea sp. TaxID=981605 RepID=UPI002632020A|nr:phage protein NinX family protein [uncultured Amphritea sp.]
MNCEHISYEHMSDFEINNLVAFALGYLVKTEIEDGLCGFTKEYHEKYPNTIWAAKTDDRGEQCEAWEQMNFCSSPEEAWPILTKMIKAGHFIAFDGDSVICDTWHQYHDEGKELMALMIVFLKMQGGE